MKLSEKLMLVIFAIAIVLWMIFKLHWNGSNDSCAFIAVALMLLTGILTTKRCFKMKIGWCLECCSLVLNLNFPCWRIKQAWNYSMVLEDC